MSLSHQQAQTLIEQSLDGMLKSNQHAALNEHLTTCHTCQSYAAAMGQLEMRVKKVLGRRWPMPANSNQELSWVAANVKSKTIGLRPVTRMANQFLRPAASFGAIAILMALMAWVIGGISTTGIPSTDLTAEESASAVPFPSETSIATMPAGTCIVTTRAVINVFEQPNTQTNVVQQLDTGLIAPVTGQYVDASEGLWLFIRLEEKSGWIETSDLSAVSGDCGMLPVFVQASDGSMFTATLPPVVAMATQPPVGTPPPYATRRPVCDVVAPSDIPLYSGPDYSSGVIGTLGSGTQIPVLSWVKGSSGVTWLNVGFGSVSSGWVTWQNVDMALLCPFIAEATPRQVTPTSSEPCIVEAVNDVPVMTLPLAASTQVGKLSPGDTASVTGQYYQMNYDVWYQIYYQGIDAWVPSTLGTFIYTGVKGNCAAVPYIDVQPAPATHTPTPVFEATPTPTPAPTNSAKCVGVTNMDGIEVFAAPAYASAVIGTLSQGMAVTVVDAYYGGDSNNWLKVEYSGRSGWISGAWTVTFNGPCGNIPPTPITPISVPIDYIASVALAVGSTSQFTQSLPGSNGDRAHVIAVKVDSIPQGNTDTSYYRTMRMQVTCTGPSAGSLRWGLFGNTSLVLSCGQYVDINMGMGWDSQYYVLQIPPDGNVSYMISLTVNSYAGP